jgi:protein tyrosine/serine phosphatase
MIEHNPPYLIHCEAGIDRTGFLSLLIEAFMGAAFDDIVKDYMLSYVEGAEFSKDDYKNGSIFIQNMFSKIKGELLYPNDDLQIIANKYLIEKIGLSNNEISLLENKLIN